MDSISARMVINNAAQAMASAGFDVSQYKLTQSFLRLEQPVVIGRTNYVFPVMINQNAPQIFNTEQRLNLQDSFVISELKFYLLNPSSAVDTTARPLTYPDPVNFPNTFEDMQAAYSGLLQISVMNNVLVTAWDLDRHYLAPQTQATAAPSAASPLNEYSGNAYGFYPVEPNIVLVGSKNNQIQIQLPEGIAALEAGSNARLGLWLRGILAQNSTVVN